MQYRNQAKAGRARIEHDEIRYFDKPHVKPSQAGRVVSINALVPVLELAPGITTRPLVGRNLLGSFVRFDPNSLAPIHAHEEEQLLVVLEGTLEIEMEGERLLVRPGDVAIIPAWVPHAVRSLSEPAYQLDVFSPPRQAMLDMLESKSRKDSQA